MKQLPVKQNNQEPTENDMTVRINNNRKADQSFSLQSNVSWQRVTDARKKSAASAFRVQDAQSLGILRP